MKGICFMQVGLLIDYSCKYKQLGEKHNLHATHYHFMLNSPSFTFNQQALNNLTIDLIKGHFDIGDTNNIQDMRNKKA